jgi:curved DNA-binding protein
MEFWRGSFTMTDSQPFVDYYEILQVNSNCDAKILETAYRHLAKMYHPDHRLTADVTKFNEVIEAYRVLRNPQKRAEYDILYATNTKDFGFRFASNNEAEGDTKAALDDADAHTRILVFLYKRRRAHAQDAGVAGFFVQEMLNCSDEHFEFHTWYLKAKGFIEITEQGTLAITIQGVDHVIATSRTNMMEKLLIAQSSHP